MERKDINTEEQQRDYYNRISKEYNQHYLSDESLSYRVRVFDKILSDIELRRARVLDAMCGGGQSTGYFLSRGAKVCGVDISEQQIETFSQRYPTCEAHCCSILQVSLPDDQFDVISVESLHHLPPHISEGIGELRRLLKPGGVLLIWEPSAGSLFDLFRKLWYRLDRRFFLSNERSISMSEIEASFGSPPERVWFGGGVGYLLVTGSMQLRIPQPFVRFYARPLMWLEDQLAFLHGRLFCCWVAATFRK